MANENVIASALSDNELARAFSELVAERWDNWDLSDFLVYLVDTCAPAALPYLADQFDVDGLRGFAMAENEEQQRDLIKKSIALHKFIGTPWSIREACRTVGFPVIVLQEGVTAVPGGPESSEDWARFRVLVEANMNRHITAEDARKLRLFVEFYKNERSHLVDLGFYQLFAETVFRPATADRDNINVDLLIFKPQSRHIEIDPDGAPKRIKITANCPWKIKQTTIMWPDGTGEKLRIKYDGSAGETIMELTADPNTTGYRFVVIDVLHPSGLVLCRIKIRQSDKWLNAYSDAYSNAYSHGNEKYYSDAYGGGYVDHSIYEDE